MSFKTKYAAKKGSIYLDTVGDLRAKELYIFIYIGL